MVADHYAKRWGPTKTAIYEAFHKLIYSLNAKYPSGQVPLDQVAKQAGVCLRTAKAHTADLIDDGFIEVLRRGGYRRGPSTYRLAFVAANPKVVSGSRLEAFPSGHQSAKSAPCDDFQSAGITPDQSAKSAPISKKELENSRSSRSREPAASAVVETQSSEPNPAAAAILEHWSGTKPSALKRCLEELREAKVSSADFVEAAARHGPALKAEASNPVLWVMKVCDRIHLQAAQARDTTCAELPGEPPPAETWTSRSDECSDCDGTGWRQAARGGVERCSCKRRSSANGSRSTGSPVTQVGLEPGAS